MGPVIFSYQLLLRRCLQTQLTLLFLVLLKMSVGPVFIPLTVYICINTTPFDVIVIIRLQIPDRNGQQSTDPRYLVTYPKYADGWTPPYRNEDGSADFQLVFDIDPDTKSVRILMPGFANAGTYLLEVANLNEVEPIYCHGELSSLRVTCKNEHKLCFHILWKGRNLKDAVVVARHCTIAWTDLV